MGRKLARRFTAEEKLRILSEARQPKTHNDAHRALVSADSDSERWMILRTGDVGPTVVDLPIGFTLGDVRGELLVGIHRDHDGFESVRVYRMP
jgi:hypothetical protein